MIGLNGCFGGNAALPNISCRDCEQMLRQHWLHLHKAASSAQWALRY